MNKYNTSINALQQEIYQKQHWIKEIIQRYL